VALNIFWVELAFSCLRFLSFLCGSAAITQWENAFGIWKKPFKLFDSAYD